MNIDLQSLFELLQQQIAEVDVVQWIVLIFGVSEVLLARANNILLYPAGIISVTLSAQILFDVGLYAESGLNLYYLVMSIYGWWHWSRKRHSPAKVGFSTNREWATTAALAVVGWLGLYFFLSTFTSSTVPVWDAWVSATAWAGMWLLARRKIENWVLLNISNAFAIPLLFYKGLPLFGALTIFLFIVACIGYFDWVKKYKSEKEREPLQCT